MKTRQKYSLKLLLNEDAAHSSASTVGDVLDLIQEIQQQSEKASGWARFKGVGIEFIKIAMGEIPLVGGTLGALDGLYAMYEAGKKQEHNWKDIEEYPILRRIKMHPELLKVLDDVVLRKIDAAYKEYLGTLSRDTLVSDITDIDVFTHKWVMEETGQAVDVAVIAELRQYIRQVLLTEAAKGPADLPDNVVIVINPNRGKEVEIYYGIAGNIFLRPEKKDLAYGSISIYDIQSDPEYGNCGGAMMVGRSYAASGWGPLLYDVAIEWATQNAGGLIADRGSVSNEAQRVWSYYEQNRDDVTAHQLDDLENTLTPEDEDNCDQDIGRSTVSGMYDTWQDSQLSKRYTKPPTTMNALGKKLVIL